MQDINYEFPAHLQKLVDLGESGTNILHGELKNMMLEVEEELIPLMQNLGELGSNEAYEDTVSRIYQEGYIDALTAVYQLTYDLSFAIAERTKLNG